MGNGGAGVYMGMIRHCCPCHCPCHCCCCCHQHCPQHCPWHCCWCCHHCHFCPHHCFCCHHCHCCCSCAYVLAPSLVCVCPVLTLSSVCVSSVWCFTTSTCKSRLAFKVMYQCLPLYLGLKEPVKTQLVYLHRLVVVVKVRKQRCDVWLAVTAIFGCVTV